MHPQRAVAEDGDGDQVADQRHRRHEHRDQPEGAVVGPPVVLVQRGVQLVVARLAAERLHRADAAERLGELHDQRGDRLRGCAGRPTVELRWNQRATRNSSGKPSSATRPSGGSSTTSTTPMVSTLNSAVTQPVQALVEQLGQRLDVAGQPADRLAGGVALVEGQRQPLDVGEHPPAQGRAAPPGRPGRTRSGRRTAARCPAPRRRPSPR